METSENYYIMLYNSWVDACQLMGEWYDIQSNIKLDRFQSQLEESYMSNHTEQLWYNKTVCLWMTIYIYIYSSKFC